MNLGRGRQATFPGQAGCEAFLETIAEACRRFRLEIHAYCLIRAHYHLLVRTPLFRGRYKAILVEAHPYLLAVSRYSHRNPINAADLLVTHPDR